MIDLFDGVKIIVEILQAIFDFIVNGIKGAIQIMSIGVDIYAMISDAVSLMPPIVIPFMGATLLVLIVYFVLSLVTG